jgi:ubiquitin carboxyl-terminal hydrolase L3
LSTMLSKCKPLGPNDRAKVLEEDEQLEAAYRSVALCGDTQAPENPEEEVDFHYVCFVKSDRNGHLYELDGDRKGPIDWGPLAPEEDMLSPRALGFLREFIQRIDRGVGFNLIALGLD